MSIFNDKSILNIQYIPTKDMIVHREKEIDQVKNIFENPSDSSHFFIFGFPGTGKTMVMNFLKNKYTDSLSAMNSKVLYLNMKKIKTESQAIASIINEMGYSPKWMSTKGYYDFFFDTLEYTNYNLIIIFDEIDKYLDRVGDTLLFVLSDTIYEKKLNSKISLVCLTNKLTAMDAIEERAKSRLTPKKIFFKPYNADQLRDILIKRAEKAILPNKLESGVIPKVAALAAQDSGDARKGLALLRIACTIAEKNGTEKVTEDDVDTALNMIDVDEVREGILYLPKQVQITLKATLDLITQNDKDVCTTSEIYERYMKIVKGYGLKPVSLRRIGDYLWNLTNQGILLSRIVYLGRSGKTREVKMAVSGKIVEKILDEVLL